MNWQMMVGVFFLLGGLGNLTKDFGTVIFIFVLGLSLLYWGLKKKGYIKKPKALPEIEDRTLIEESFHAVGVSYYENNIRKHACSNPDWKLSAAQLLDNGKAGKRVFKHNYINKPVKLIEEIDNPHDENAVAVVIAGELVGYISREDNIHVKDILQNHEIKALSGFIGGGEYKIIDEDGDFVKDVLGFSVNIRMKYI